MSPPASGLADACTGGTDAGSNVAEAWRLMKGTTCSGAASPSDLEDWYFVDVPVTDTQATLYYDFCRPRETLELNVFFVPAGYLVPWTGTSELGSQPRPFSYPLDPDYPGTVHGGSAGLCLSNAFDPGLQTARPYWPATGGGRFYVRVFDAQNDPSSYAATESYTLTLW